MTDAVEAIRVISTTFPSDLPPPYASIAVPDISRPRTCHISQVSLFSEEYPRKLTSINTDIVPITPLNNQRRKHTKVPFSETDQSYSATEEFSRTPPRRAIRDEQEQKPATFLKASSSPVRCSPSKRGPPFSSSSPSRHSSRENVLRARPDLSRSTRTRSNSSSRTIYITESFASATMHCNADPYAGAAALSTHKIGEPLKTTSKKETTEETSMGFGVSTFQVVRIGLSKYTPLLKPHWLLSEPWKVESTVSKIKATSEPESMPRGHRRSKASESIAHDGFSEVLLQQKLPRSTASFIESPPLTAKEDITILTPVNTPDLIHFSPPLLGPAFAEDMKSSAPGVVSLGNVRRPVAARATRGRSVHSYRSLTEVAQSANNRGTLFSKRCRRLPFASLSGMSQIHPRSASVSLSPQNIVISEQNGDGLGIVCMQDKPTSPTMDRKGSIDSVACSVSGICSPTFSTSSSVPSIVVTPPAIFSSRHLQEKEQRVYREGIRLEYPECDTPCSSVLTTPNISPAPSPSLQIPLGNPISLLTTPSPPSLLEHTTSPSEEVCLLRSQEDDRGIATFKVAVDAILSDYFVYRTVARTGRLAHQLVLLVQGVLGCRGCKPIQSMRANTAGKVSSPANWSLETPLIVIPSLCGRRWIGEGSAAVRVPSQWGAVKLQTTLKLVMDHIVTGMIALVTDDRAPYETPIALGHLCRSLQEELPTCLGLVGGDPTPCNSTNKGKHTPDSPITSWVKACASVESPDSIQSSISSSLLDHNHDVDEAEWCLILQDTNPKAVFLSCLQSTIQTTYEKGEAIRSKANLLAVPPPRKGSRKKWQAANAEMNAQKALREKEISQVTCGDISVPEFRRRERKRAAVGSIRDNFAAFFFVRFVGELYNSNVLDVIVIRQWLQRFFFKTVFPGVPSSYELEAGCALLITVGETLDEQAGTFTPEMKRSGYFACPNEVEIETKEKEEIYDSISADIEDLSISTPGPSSSAQTNRVDDVPANHWILVSPRAVRERYASGSCHGDLISDDNLPLLGIFNKGDESITSCNNKTIATRTITATMARLKEILTIREVHAESRVWCREVLALRNRFWVQYDTGTSHKVGTTIRKMKRDLWGA